jgi:hypothetical protein
MKLEEDILGTSTKGRERKLWTGFERASLQRRFGLHPERLSEKVFSSRTNTGHF